MGTVTYRRGDEDGETAPSPKRSKGFDERMSTDPMVEGGSHEGSLPNTTEGTVQDGQVVKTKSAEDKVQAQHVESSN